MIVTAAELRTVVELLAPRRNEILTAAALAMAVRLLPLTRLETAK
ncbi:hypothetical protein [Halomonas sp. BC04]|nr:hypothetical protein [Halomonas sp. BC04]EWH00461.1 hypothetical protein Q427_19355 [Halomonas sp. BC04]